MRYRGANDCPAALAWITVGPRQAGRRPLRPVREERRWISPFGWRAPAEPLLKPGSAASVPGRYDAPRLALEIEACRKPTRARSSRPNTESLKALAKQAVLAAAADRPTNPLTGAQWGAIC
jgi:hypothetical protein